MLRNALIAILAVAPTLLGQSHEKVLIPIMIAGEVPGAYGSRFATELVVHNSSPRYVRIGLDPTAVCVGACPVPPAQPGTTHELRYSPPVPGGGVFLYVQSPTDGLVTFNLRVKDLSRQSLTWGTEIPVVRSGDTFTETLQLLNLPLDTRFRHSLRIYDFDGGRDKAVRLRIYPMEGTDPIVDTVLTLSEGRNGPGPSSGLWPGYAQVNSIAETFPQIKVAERLRIRIDSASTGLRFWAFASVTNNETQHITLITPSQL